MFVILMPKRISLIELYATTGVALYIQLLTDVYLHLKLNWFGYFSQTKIE
jgi:predicted small integral membrane protein